MKTKTIFKTLAMAMMMPAMLLTTACSSDDDAIANNPENNNQKGYAIPVTVNVTRQGDATTRAEYNESTKELAFSTGDQLFVTGTDGTAGAFAGTLAWQSGDTFSGTIYTTNEYSGTANALLGSASTATATLLPAGYESIGYLTVDGDGYGASLTTDPTKAFVTSKAAAVEQLSLEQATAYSNGFALAPQNAILNFTAVTGQWGEAPASSTVSLQAGETTVSGSVAPVEGDYSRALAKFAIAVADSETPSSLTLTVDGTSVSLGTHALTAGKIYNQKCANINAISPLIQENEKWLVYGTGEPSGWRLTIAEGATVTLHNVNLNNYAIIAYRGNNTIILADGTTNTIDPGSGVAIEGMMTGDKTLTIKGTGTLIATGGYDAPAIGIQNPEFESCGDITIENTVTLTATAGAGQSKAITTGTGGGTVTIGGVVYADGAPSPFIYPIPAPAATTVTWDFSVLSGTAGTGYENGGVKLEACDGEISFDYNQLNAWGNGITITNTLGKKFTSIVINGTEYGVGIFGGGWSNADDNSSATWTGNSESVYIEGSSTASGITSIVFTLEDAPAPAGPVTYTELKGGEVLHVGDIINLSEDISINDGYNMPVSGSPYTVIRADLDFYEYDDPDVYEKADGKYYVIKADDGYYYPFEGALGVTGTSDGILVTYNGIPYGYKDYTFTVHEP